MRFSSVTFGLPYLLIELHCIGVPVVRRTVYSHVITKFSRMSVGLADETVADPDLRIRGGGGGVIQTLIFLALRASLWLKNKGVRVPGPLPWIRHCGEVVGS